VKGKPLEETKEENVVRKGFRGRRVSPFDPIDGLEKAAKLDREDIDYDNDRTNLPD
jgi:hypothetical protein